MAHKRGLDGTCLKPTMEECFAEFKKAIPELTVNNSARKQAELEQKEQENMQLRGLVDQRLDEQELQIKILLEKIKPVQSQSQN